MAELVELSHDKHGEIRVSEASRAAFAGSRHIMALRANEVGRAAAAFPVFFSRSAQTGDGALSALMSVRPGMNVFVEDQNWLATYEPSVMQTHPLYLMRSDTDERGYVVGIDGGFESASEEGELLFEEGGQPSLYLSKATSILEGNLENDQQTHLFIETVEEFDLLKPINLLVFFEDGETQTVTGLSTVDEDKLQSVSGETLQELNGNGYLMVLHAMLMSIFQLNLIIQRHNQNPGLPPITQIKLEVARDPN